MERKTNPGYHMSEFCCPLTLGLNQRCDWDEMEILHWITVWAWRMSVILRLLVSNHSASSMDAESSPEGEISVPVSGEETKLGTVVAVSPAISEVEEGERTEGPKAESVEPSGIYLRKRDAGVPQPVGWQVLPTWRRPEAVALPGLASGRVTCSFSCRLVEWQPLKEVVVCGMFVGAKIKARFGVCFPPS